MDLCGLLFDWRVVCFGCRRFEIYRYTGIFLWHSDRTSFVRLYGEIIPEL